MRKLLFLHDLLFGKKKPVFSFGAKDAEGFAPLLKDGKPTNCRMYLWDRKEVDELAAIGRSLQQ